MNSQPENPKKKGTQSRHLMQHILESEYPEQLARTLPAQSLYLAARQQGLSASSALIELASLEQCRSMYDLDVWTGDRFFEDNFWDWLELPDDSDGLEILQKFLKFADLKTVAILCQKYVHVEIHEEPTDQAPHAGYHTPDKGHTWVFIKLEDERKHFLLGRLLALIFETNTELFYQILAIPDVATQSMLEEDAFQERGKRLAAEGVPDFDFSFSLHAKIDEQEIRKLLQEKTSFIPVDDIRAVHAFSAGKCPKPLEAIENRFASDEAYQRELTLLANAALVRWGIPMHETEKVNMTLAQVRGAINLGLERAMTLEKLDADEVFDCLGLSMLFRFGLSTLYPLSSELDSLLKRFPQLDTEPIFLALDDCLRSGFPSLPAFLQDDGSLLQNAEGKLEAGPKEVSHLEQITLFRKTLESLSSQYNEIKSSEQ